MKHITVLIMVIGIAGAGIAALLAFPRSASAPLPHHEPMVRINDLSIPVEIADSSEEWSRGLSGRQSLPAEQGMLFVFPAPGMYPFWMPDMRFPIDIIWIDQDRRVIGVSENVPPLENAAKPVYYRPPSPAQYVLEVNAGFARSHGITVGDQLSLPDIQ
jgi:uncharacterized membrane protein (UPF0127 family)